MLNHWRMAQLHAQEAPDRVLELERWGALFDRTKDGRILQRDFGGHRYARLAHVGDRTGLEMIRTLQQHGVHLGIDVFMECTVTRLLKDGERVAGAVATGARAGSSSCSRRKAIVLATGGIGKSYASRRTPGSTPATAMPSPYRAGAELIDMEFVQFHPTGMVWPPSVRGILVTEGVRGDGGTLRNSRRRAVHVPTTSRPSSRTETADTRKRRTAGTRTRRTTAGRRTSSRGTMVARAINAEVKAGRGSPHGGVFLDISTRRSAEYITQALPSMYHQFKELGGRRHHQGGHGSRADLPLHDGRRPRRRRHDRGGGPARALRGGRVRRRHARLEPPRRQLPVGPARLRPPRGAARGRACPRLQGDARASTLTRSRRRSAR